MGCTRRVALSAGSILLFAAASAFASLQVTPDQSRSLIIKQVGNEHWAITWNHGESTVTGAVRLGEDGSAFLSCQAELTDSPNRTRLSCWSAQPCLTSPCPPQEWTFSRDVVLPMSFFRPPAGPTPTPAPIAGLTALEGEWTFASATAPPLEDRYELGVIVYQFGRPVLVGLTRGSAMPVSALALDENDPSMPAAYSFALLAPGPEQCTFHLFDPTSDGRIAGVTYLVGLGPGGSCLPVAPGQPSFSLTGERDEAPTAAAAAARTAQDTSSLNKALLTLAGSLSRP